MLVLNRGKNERIMINDDIIITVVETSNKSAKLGIDAPKDVTIHREEVYIKVKKEEALKNGTSKEDRKS